MQRQQKNGSHQISNVFLSATDTQFHPLQMMMRNTMLTISTIVWVVMMTAPYLPFWSTELHRNLNFYHTVVTVAVFMVFKVYTFASAPNDRNYRQWLSPLFMWMYIVLIVGAAIWLQLYPSSIVNHPRLTHLESIGKNSCNIIFSIMLIQLLCHDEPM
jgi:magnesium-transporting ATPase (P-type)